MQWQIYVNSVLRRWGDKNLPLGITVKNVNSISDEQLFEPAILGHTSEL